MYTYIFFRDIDINKLISSGPLDIAFLLTIIIFKYILSQILPLIVPKYRKTFSKCNNVMFKKKKYI